MFTNQTTRMSNDIKKELSDSWRDILSNKVASAIKVHTYGHGNEVDVTLVLLDQNGKEICRTEGIRIEAGDSVTFENIHEMLVLKVIF